MALNTTTTRYNSPMNDLNRMVAMIVGGVLLLVGLIGFANDPVLGIFEVDAVHNVIHILTGAVLLAAAFINNGMYARTVNITLGVVYLLVALLGWVTPAFMGSIFQYNMADNWLHLLLGVVLTGVGFASRRDVTRPATGAIR
jgi:hypothetical protein